MTLREAAERLGMTKPGIRHRMKVIGIPLEKDAFGRVELSEEVLQCIRDGKKPESVGESDEKQREEAESVSETSEQNGQETERDPESGGKLEKDSESIPERKRKFRKEKRKKAESAEAFALAVLQERLDKMEREVERLNNKLDERERRIDELTDKLTDALAKAQILHAGSVRLLREAEEETPSTEEEDQPERAQNAEEKETIRPKKKSWLDRILGRV